MDQDLVLPTVKEAVVLDLLNAGKKHYGLELVKASNGKIRRGTVYVLLDRLEQKGFVTSKAEKKAGLAGLPRRMYAITGAGQRALAARQAAYAVFAGGLLAIEG